jgi:hypothetical protein
LKKKHRSGSKNYHYVNSSCGFGSFVGIKSDSFLESKFGPGFGKFKSDQDVDFNAFAEVNSESVLKTAVDFNPYAKIDSDLISRTQFSTKSRIASRKDAKGEPEFFGNSRHDEVCF